MKIATSVPLSPASDRLLDLNLITRINDLTPWKKHHPVE
jgi:hypothetical protein